MFERYTENARRVIFFARYEASMFGGSEIDTEHLLLGLIREGGTRAGTVLGGSSLTHDAVSRAVRERSTPGPKRPTSVDLPLSTAARRVLDCAGDDATRMGSPHVGTEHLLIGLLQQEDTLAFRLLDEAGVRLDKAREEARLRIHAKPAATLEGAPFAKLVYLLTRLDERRARYHVSAFGRDAIRVEVAVPGQPWMVTFFADGRVGVETYAPTGGVADDTLLQQLLERLGPPTPGNG